MTDLQVHLYGTHVGGLVGATWRDFDFEATSEGIERFGVGSTVLSESVPLVPRQPRARAARRRNFFDELLPEGVIRQRLADRMRIDPNDTLGLLSAYGRDAAGAVQVIESTSSDADEPPRARAITHAGIADLLNDTAGFPLGNAPLSGKASLAGMQEKLLLARVDGRWGQCLYGYPSTHILKPVSRAHPTMIFDEEYCSRLARALGLAAYSTSIESFDGTDALVIERYDRSADAPGGRIHQEDMSQVLGASGAEKYQEHRGKVRLLRIAQVLSGVQGREGLERLLSMVTLAVATGNLDMHAKNISLLHPPDGSARLAPLYDVVPMTRYPGVDARMALAVNDVYEHSRITRGDVIDEAVRWGVTADRAGDIVDETASLIRRTVASEIPHPRALDGLPDMIDGHAARLQSDR
jgi:serine/threonine-protein kinase HipA